MAPRNYFTTDEITLCACAAMYDARDFGGERSIESRTRRGPASIKMKIQNIAAMRSCRSRKGSAQPAQHLHRRGNFVLGFEWSLGLLSIGVLKLVTVGARRNLRLRFARQKAPYVLH